MVINECQIVMIFANAQKLLLGLAMYQKYCDQDSLAVDDLIILVRGKGMIKFPVLARDLKIESETWQ